MDMGTGLLGACALRPDLVRCLGPGSVRHGLKGLPSNPLSVLHIFTMQGLATCLQRSGDNQAVVKAEVAASLQIEAPLVQCPGWIDVPKRHRPVVQQLTRFVRRRIEFAGRNVNRLLDDLTTDATSFVLQSLLHPTLCARLEAVSSSKKTQIWVSRKSSTLIHFVPRELPSSGENTALQLADDAHSCGSLLFAAYVVLEPQPKLPILRSCALQQPGTGPLRSDARQRLR